MGLTWRHSLSLSRAACFALVSLGRASVAASEHEERVGIVRPLSVAQSRRSNAPALGGQVRAAPDRADVTQQAQHMGKQAGARAAMAARRGQLHFGRPNEPGWNPRKSSAEFTSSSSCYHLEFRVCSKGTEREELEFAFTLQRVSRLPASQPASS